MSLASLFSDTVSLCRGRPVSSVNAESGFPDVAEAPPDARRLIRDRRYCHVLYNDSEIPFDNVSISFAWKALAHEMALVPGGEIRLAQNVFVDGHGSVEADWADDELIHVESVYLDRNCVTNADYARFVDAGGYSDASFWPEEALPSVLQFVDRSGSPGPKYWSGGSPPADRLDHPVVGICWYEANAFALWAGKRLPSTEQWQRAGTWPKGHTGNGRELRYPWGNGFDPSNANLWASRIASTVPVDQFPAGNTPNGIRQLIGNIWEWVDALYCPETIEGGSILMDEAMAEIRGGAFDTYFHSQATCQFRTGQSLLSRNKNVGFRCCISQQILPVPAAENTDPASPESDSPSHS